MKIALFPGSFDPLTNGHLDIIFRGSLLFDKLFVLVTYNEKKEYLFKREDRVRLIKENIKDLKNVEVISSTELTVEEAKKRGAKFLLRGFRNYKDIEDEMELEMNNKFLDSTIETVYLSSNKENLNTRSSSVKEFLHHGVDISSFVPKNVEKELLKIFQSKWTILQNYKNIFQPIDINLYFCLNVF